jgi:hypothetical protein
MLGRTALSVCVLLSLCGCPRKSGPSVDYAEASTRYTQLYAQKSEDAYLDPAMDAVIAALERVPTESQDSPAAQDLLQKIRAGRADAQVRADALKKDMEVLHQPPPPGTFTQTPPSPPPTPPPAVAAAVDSGSAGPSEPASGMSVSDFQKKFGDCFDADKPINVVGVGLRDTYVLKPYNRCKDALPGFDQRLVIVDSQQVLGVMPKSAIETVTVDAGPPTPAPPPPPDAGA